MSVMYCSIESTVMSGWMGPLKKGGDPTWGGGGGAFEPGTWDIYIDAPARSSSAHPSFKFCDTDACCATLNATAVRISVEYQSTIKLKASIRKCRQSKIKMTDPTKTKTI